MIGVVRCAISNNWIWYDSFGPLLPNPIAISGLQGNIILASMYSNKKLSLTSIINHKQKKQEQNLPQKWAYQNTVGANLTNLWQFDRSDPRFYHM